MRAMAASSAYQPDVHNLKLLVKHRINLENNLLITYKF